MVYAQQRCLALLNQQGELAITNVTTPEPGLGELQVCIQASALNPQDWKVQAQGYLHRTLPACLGRDAAGIVTKVGQGVSSFAQGDRVFYAGGVDNRTATFQQYSVVPASLAAKIPDNLSFEQACSIPVAFITAALGLYKAGVMPVWEESWRGRCSGQHILILGGASCVGQFAIQLARIAGFSPIITTASPHNTFFLESLGATYILDRNFTVSECLEILSNLTSAPIRLVYDAISCRETQVIGYERLAREGKIILVSPFAFGNENLTANKEVIHVYADIYMPETRTLVEKLWEKIPVLFESGDIKPPRIELLPNGLQSIPKGLERLKNGEVSAKRLVIRPQDTP